jgi:integrase
MASITKLPSGRWRVRWREHANGPQMSKSFDRKVDADAFAANTAADLSRGVYVRPSKVTFSDYTAEWLAGQAWRESTRERNDSLMRKHLTPEFGSKQLTAIRPNDVRAFVARLSGDLSPAMVESIYRLLASIMRSAAGDRMIQETPCRNVRLPRKAHAHGALTPLTPRQLHELADAVPDRMRRWVLVTAGLGLRQGEACGLTLDRVNFLKRTVRIDRQLVTRTGFVGLGPVKTPASNRVIPLPDNATVMINEQIEAYGLGPDRVIFTDNAGGFIRRQRIGGTFTTAARATGLEVTAHDLRHFAASALIAAGASVEAVQAFLGHATAAETLDTYGHLWPSDEDTIRDALNGHLDRAVSTA